MNDPTDTLAVVIPAFKSAFLSATLDSLVSQTDKNFSVYIGDDASPNDIKSIVDRYSGQLNIRYHRFETNFGGQNLVSHWHRCIELAADEKWIWLFSDDDVMSANCIEELRRAVNEYGNQFPIYHIDINIVNESGNIIRSPARFPQMLTVDEFIKRRRVGNLKSFVVEYIFDRRIFEKCGRFQAFDLAWSSDDATWIKIGFDSGIYTLPNCAVHWRSSSLNITPNVKDKEIVARKIEALIEFSKWTYNFYRLKKREHPINDVQNLSWFARSLSEFHGTLSEESFRQSCQKFVNENRLTISESTFLRTIAYEKLKYRAKKTIMKVANKFIR